jgi:alpha-L-fucosidase
MSGIDERLAAVRPTPRQQAWQELEFIAFAHFGVNTFTDREWGDGTEDPAIFAPTALDASQWVEACCQAGMRMIILTAKHHDGFCLWPSAHTEHSVRRSPWRGGKGDVVREVVEACRQGGLKLGIYCSPWDRHEPTYGNSPAYNEHFCRQLTELLTQYGQISEVWFDGACAEGPNGRRQEYDWERYYAAVRQHQPDAVIAICGPDVRWVGNESGLARQDEWSVLPATAVTDEEVAANFTAIDAQAGDLTDPGRLAAAERLIWYPAECDVSIRPGWFYHAAEDLRVKSLEQLTDIYYRSVGRNSLLLLNVPPDRRGLFHEHDAARLRELRAALDATFAENLVRRGSLTADSVARVGHGVETVLDGRADTWWMAAEDRRQAILELDLGESPPVFDRLELREQISLGQRIAHFRLEGWDAGTWKPICEGRSVGYCRLDRFGRVRVPRVRLVLDESRGCPALRSFGLYCS